MINVSHELYAELITIKGHLEVQKKENASMEDVIAYLLSFYKEKQEAGE